MRHHEQQQAPFAGAPGEHKVAAEPPVGVQLTVEIEQIAALAQVERAIVQQRIGPAGTGDGRWPRNI